MSLTDAHAPRLLDLFCKAGGAAKGYALAGFEVVGIDIEPQPNYPFEFHQMNALDVLWWADGAAFGFDAIHASPPCQRYMTGGLVDRAKHPDLLGPTRELLERTALPYVIENVPGAPLRHDVMLCGSMFGLEVRRHRYFESNASLDPWTPPCDHSRRVTGVYGNPHGEKGAWPGMLPSNLETWSRAMGIDWMTAPELAAAIPPAYTEFIGARLLAALEVAA